MLSETQRQKLRRIVNLLKSRSEYRKDRQRFLRASTAIHDPNTKCQLAAHLTIDYHRLEKGLALPKPRFGFGTDVVERLLTNVSDYQQRFGEDELIDVVIGVLVQYQSRQADLGYKNLKLDKELAEFDLTRASQKCGVSAVPIADLFVSPSEHSQAFLASRRSVRQYTGQLVDREIIEGVARLAQRAPSVCNRQAGRLYFANSRETIDEVLRFQNGNRGFGDTLGGVFIVTANQSSFVSLGERNQGYVDGGIFAQQTLLALHAHGLGACMLNWSMTHNEDSALRDRFGIADNEIVITMIGFGPPVAIPLIAVSPRVALSDVLYAL